MYKYLFTFFISLMVLKTTFSQKTLSFKLPGKWTVCDSFTFSKEFDCKNGYMTYEFFDNGTFKDPRPSKDAYGDHASSMGEWRLQNNILVIDYNDVGSFKNPPKIYEIKFINNTLFYASGREGENGPIAYTYFQKVK